MSWCSRKCEAYTCFRELAAQTHKIFELFLSSQPSLDSEAPSGSSSSSKAPPPSLNPALLLTTSAAASGFSIRTSPIPSILVSTPGSLLTFLSSHHCPSVRDLDTLVLDEADRLLDPGFTNVLTKVFERLPKQRRTGLFSATMTDAEALAELVRAGLRNPARVVVRVAAKRKVGEGGAAGASTVAEERRIPARYTFQSFFSCASILRVGITAYKTTT
jgi:ATP-dependent RNA helicase DDX55/SPB4